MSQEASGTPQKQSKLVVILLVLVVLLLAGGGAGAYWIFTQRGTAAAPAPPPPVEEGIVAFDPFVVNLADAGSTRFLRLSLRLVINSEEVAKEMEEHELERMKVRSAILELLAQQTADHLVTPEGKTALKEAIIERAGHALNEVKVLDVLFTEFVVQF
jgi:flagellar FliL protein